MLNQELFCTSIIFFRSRLKLIIFPSILSALLPEGAVFLNVGRGDIVKSEDLLAALASGPLSGVALDVTDPEPLPDNHPLYSHPKVIITPHTSANVEGYFDVGADLLIENVRRVRKGGKAINKVDPKRGY